MSENVDATLQLRQEQLEIAKKWVQTGDVKIYKETSVKEKTFTIPITSQELIIEKKDITSNNHNDDPTQTIRIPLNEEQVTFTKHKITLEDVSIYSEQIEDTKQVKTTLKHEEGKINISGSPNIIDKSDPVTF